MEDMLDIQALKFTRLFRGTTKLTITHAAEIHFFKSLPHVKAIPDGEYDPFQECYVAYVRAKVEERIEVV